jgi:hypothetical protein
VKKVENKIVYYKDTVECRYVIFWPGNQRRVHCHTAKLEPNQSVATDWVLLLVSVAYPKISICLVGNGEFGMGTLSRAFEVYGFSS